MDSVHSKYVQIQREKVGDILYKLISFFLGTFKMLDVKCLLLKKKVFVTTPFISSLFN